MHVEDAAIYDVTFSVSSLRESLDLATHAVLENQRQLATVAALCNAASFEGSPSDSNRKINGDATGEHRPDFIISLQTDHIARLGPLEIRGFPPRIR